MSTRLKAASIDMSTIALLSVAILLVSNVVEGLELGRLSPEVEDSRCFIEARYSD
jgi:hypothetical protein